MCNTCGRTAHDPNGNWCVVLVVGGLGLAAIGSGILLARNRKRIFS